MKTKDKIRSVIEKLEETYGVERWQKKNRNPLDVLIKTVLSQSTSDWNRDLAWDVLKHRYPNWEEVLKLSKDELADTIRSAGLANQKSERILNILQWIKNEHGILNIDFICGLPTEKVVEVFTRLKGIGIKTISVVLAFACGKDIFPVDTHVHRLCRRFGFVPKNAAAEKTHDLMQQLVPAGKSYSFHINLLKHGRQICKAQNPQCGLCPVFEWCEYDLKWERQKATLNQPLSQAS
jgi:endonuclease-3